MVDFIDVTLNLMESTYKPYHKPNDEIFYVHKESNHQSSKRKQLPISFETKLSKIFLSKKVFDASVTEKPLINPVISIN